MITWCIEHPTIKTNLTNVPKQQNFSEKIQRCYLYPFRSFVADSWFINSPIRYLIFMFRRFYFAWRFQNVWIKSKASFLQHVHILISRIVHDRFTWNFIHPLKNMIKKLNRLYNYIWYEKTPIFRYETTIYDGKTISQGHHQCSMFNKISIWDPARNAIPFPFVRL